jgi:hypothetical protein
MFVEVGSVVKVDHPQTCINPTEYFAVEKIRVDVTLNKCSVKGADTSWFGTSMIVDVL